MDSASDQLKIYLRAALTMLLALSGEYIENKDDPDKSQRTLKQWVSY